MAEITKQALSVANSLAFPNNNNGAITPTDLRGFNTDMIDSLVDEISYNIDSGSFNNSINLINQFTASITVSVNLGPLNQASASLQSFTASMNVYTTSVNTSITNLNSTTASQGVSITNLNASSASQQISINALNTNSASINTFTQSVEISITNLNASSASQQVSINSINAASSSFITESETSSFARTNVNNTFNGIQSFDNVVVSGTASISFLNVTFQSSSIIYSSGSNQLGDEIIDVQTLIGTTRMSGSMVLTGSIALTGLVDGIDLSVFASNVNTTTASLNTSITNLNQFSSSQLGKDTTLSSYTASVNQTTASLNTFTSSANSRLNNIETTTASLNTSVTNLNLVTASFARINTSNQFTGSQTISGSLIITGSASGNVVALSITSNTASMNLNLGNYFTLTLANTTTTHIVASNIQPGTSAMLVITTGTNSSASLSPLLLQPTGSLYVASNGSTRKDVLSFASVDSTNMFVVATKNMV